MGTKPTSSARRRPRRLPAGTERAEVLPRDESSSELPHAALVTEGLTWYEKITAEPFCSIPKLTDLVFRKILQWVGEDVNPQLLQAFMDARSRSKSLVPSQDGRDEHRRGWEIAAKALGLEGPLNIKA